MADVGRTGEPVDLADHVLSRLVGRVSLAGEDELDRPVGIEQQRPESLHLAEQQRGAFVGRETPGEADGQHVRVEHGLTGSMSHHVDEFATALVAHVPDLVMVEVLDLGPFVLVGEVPVVADRTSEQFVDSVADPRPGVDAVGDVADRDLADGEIGPEATEHLA